MRYLATGELARDSLHEAFQANADGGGGGYPQPPFMASTPANASSLSSTATLPMYGTAASMQQAQMMPVNTSPPQPLLANTTSKLPVPALGVQQSSYDETMDSYRPVLKDLMGLFWQSFWENTPGAPTNAASSTSTSATRSTYATSKEMTTDGALRINLGGNHGSMDILKNRISYTTSDGSQTHMFARMDKDRIYLSEKDTYPCLEIIRGVNESDVSIALAFGDQPIEKAIFRAARY